MSGETADKNPKAKAKAQKKMEEALIKYITSTATQEIPNLRKIVHHMIYSGKGNQIFVGQNANSITGFLGELQALC